jgi:ABC-type transporter Mla subunit MlaD
MDVFLGIICLAVVAATVTFICVMIEVRNSTRSLKGFVKRAGETLKLTEETVRSTEASLRPALEELQQTLKSVRRVTDNVGSVTEDVTVFSGSVRAAGENIRRITRVVDDLTISSTIQVPALKAGIRAAIGVVVQNVLAKCKKT